MTINPKATLLTRKRTATLESKYILKKNILKEETKMDPGTKTDGMRIFKKNINHVL